MCKVESNKLVVCNWHRRSATDKYALIYLCIGIIFTLIFISIHQHIDSSYIDTSIHLCIYIYDGKMCTIYGFPGMRSTEEVHDSPGASFCGLTAWGSEKDGRGKRKSAIFANACQGIFWAKTLYTCTLIHIDTQTNANVSCRQFGPCLGQGSGHCWATQTFYRSHVTFDVKIRCGKC